MKSRAIVNITSKAEQYLTLYNHYHKCWDNELRYDKKNAKYWGIVKAETEKKMIALANTMSNRDRQLFNNEIGVDYFTIFKNR